MGVEKISSSYSPLHSIIQNHKHGRCTGIYSVCSAHPAVLEASFHVAASAEKPLLIEATCNQVNQEGGYMGMVPADFANYVRSLADQFAYPPYDLILGGDHLGPFPWRNEPTAKAMEKARLMVSAYVQAGFSKIHLDASMPCASDPKDKNLDPKEIASRTADLCEAAESASSHGSGKKVQPLYVIGTEVPAPGGFQSLNGEMHITKPEDVLQTIELTKKEFLSRNLDSAWERVLAIVVQPGVEFGNQIVHPYNSSSAVELSKFIERFKLLVYEAHSTDYQTPKALARMVEDHFAILKVGPALTFAYREAIFALAFLEREWLGGRADVQISDLPGVLEEVMLAEPEAWNSYYAGTPLEVRLALKYSFSDRCRYYWTHPKIQASVKRLFGNLSAAPIPPTLISEFMPVQYQRFRADQLPSQPYAWVIDRISDALQPYLSACFGG